MTAQDVLGELRALVDGARGRPMSSTVSVNRSQLLDLVRRLEQALAADDAHADGTASAQRADGARRESERIVADARQERDRLLGDTELVRVAKVEAERERSAARRDAEELRRAADDYVDTRLATFEVTLTKTLEAVTRGRERLHGRSHFADLSDGDGDGGAEAAGGDAAATGEEFEPPSASG